MAGRLKRLFRRYATHHLRLVQPGPVLADASGTPLGKIERILLQDGLMILEGHARAHRVLAQLGGAQRSAVIVPRLGSAPSFRLTLPFARGPLLVALEGEGEAPPQEVPGISAARLWRAKLALLPGFGLRAAQAFPAARHWLRTQDPAARDRVKRILGLVSREDHLLAPDIFVPQPQEISQPAASPDGPAAASRAAAAAKAEQRVTVILPVYNAFDLLRDCLDRLVRHSDLPWRLILIEDASSDPRVLPFLRDFAQSRPEGQVELIENASNLGFIGAVNRGLSRALEASAGQGTGQGAEHSSGHGTGHGIGQDPLVLLNSDALVPQGWLSRLTAPLYADPQSVASVTPMSNDAELGSVPLIGRPVPVSEVEALAIDAIAQRFPPGAGLASGPTGVGFCMALNPVYLAKAPLLDTTFGRGYGEEVDWCQKVAALGGQHLYQPRLFVEHRGGSSFGSDEKRRQLQKNGQIISQRYPRFDEEVQLFLAEDPLLTPRLALGLGLAGARVEARGAVGDGPPDWPPAVPIYLAHSWGGGAEQWLARQIAADVAALGAAVVLRVGGSRRWRLELHSATEAASAGPDASEPIAGAGQAETGKTEAGKSEGGKPETGKSETGEIGVTAGASDDTELIRSLLALLPRRRVIYSCGAGDGDPLALPQMLLDLLTSPEDRLEVLLHDYFPISPAFTLLTRSGRYAGVPQPGIDADSAHSTLRPDGSLVDLVQWRREWDRLIARADRVVVFSQASRAIAEAAWPKLGARLDVRPHALPPLPPRLPSPPPGARPVIGILGNVGLHKGAALVTALSRLLAADRQAKSQAELVILGALDPGYRLAKPARQHGPYRIDELPELVKRYGITCWLIPSICPETFSFTTREVLATGLPVWCLDLGAQAEAVSAALAKGAPGGIIPLEGEAPLETRVLAALLAQPRAQLHLDEAG